MGMEIFTFKDMDEAKCGLENRRLLLLSFNMLFYGTWHSLVYDLNVYYHYHTVYNKETVSGEEILI